MNVVIEISYYPLNDDFIKPIDDFIDDIKKTGLEYKIGQMSTTINGNMKEIMNFLSEKLQIYMQKYPSVFILKIANSCDITTK